MTPAEQLKSQVAELSSALLQQHPRMPSLLRDIHTHIAKDPELATLLTEDEIGVIVSGLMKQTGTEILNSAAARNAAATKMKKNGLSLDDI